MKRLRLPVLVSTLVLVVFLFYYQRFSGVRVETVWLQSQTTGRLLPYNVILPRGYRLAWSRARYPVLYLLHGHSGNYQSWVANSDLTKDLANHSLIVITPEGEDGWYVDSATVPVNKFESYLIAELIPDVERRFRVVPERASRGIAGYSMGGYGALKFGLKHPDLFAFAGSMSGAFDAPLRTNNASIMKAFGPMGSDTRAVNDLSRIIPGLKGILPQIYFDCGTDDPWLNANRALDEEMRRFGIAHQYRETSGAHDWAYWNRRIQELLPLAISALAPQHN